MRSHGRATWAPKRPIRAGKRCLLNRRGSLRFTEDLRHALRLARKNPWFTAVTIVTLALGLSTNITLLSLINLLLFKPLPVKDADRLVVLLEQTSSNEAPRGLSWADYRDYRAEAGAFTDVLALVFRPAHLAVTGRTADRAWIEGVSGNYFAMLGITPHSGRLFLPGEGETAGADPIAVLSHHYWQTRLGADPSIVGKAIVINGRALTVIGITPPEFTSAQWALAPSAFVPATMLPQLFAEYDDLLDSRTEAAFRVMAHLRPGVRVPEAAAAVQVVSERLIAQYRPEQKQARVLVLTEPSTRPVPNVSRFVPFAAAIFLLMAIMVLFVACANVANLMFSRALARQKEMAIRTAIGASRARLIRQLLTESVFVALLAAAVGMLLSYGSGRLLARIAPQGDIPVRPDDRFDWTVALVTLGVSVAVGVLTGLVPALRSTRVDVHEVLKSGGNLAGSARQGFRSQLVISQVAVCVIVLVCGGLFLRSLQDLARHDLGFRSDGLLMASLDLGLPGHDDERGRRLVEQLPERMLSVGGVTAAAIGSSVPFDTAHDIRSIVPAEQTVPAEDAGPGQRWRAGVNRVDSGYLRAMGVPLLRGRGITPRDISSTPRVAIVNETFARRLWAGQDPLGRRFRWQRGDTLDEPIEVIGVVRDGKYVTVGEAQRAYAYVPIAQDYGTSVTLHVRTAAGDPLSLVPALRRAVREFDPDVPVYNVRTMSDHLRNSVFAFLPVRMGALLAGVQGTLALLLAMMSVYAVVAWSVRQQTRTIGVHVALGAKPGDLFLLVSRSALRPALIGLAIGAAVSIAFARVLASLLYGLDPMSLPVFLAVVVLVLGVSLFACWLPARRALRVDPVRALRAE
jgi:predicted permease